MNSIFKQVVGTIGGFSVIYGLDLIHPGLSWIAAGIALIIYSFKP